MTTSLRPFAALGALSIAAVAAGGLLSLSAASAATSAVMPKGFAGSFQQVAAVPHTSDVVGIASYQTSQGTGEIVAMRHKGKWRNVTPGSDVVAAVASAGVKATWVGGSDSAIVDYQYPAIAHWNGKRFVNQKLDASNGVVSYLAASSAKNAWASGVLYTHAGITTEHWNGHKWAAVRVPVAVGDGLGAIATSRSTNTLVIDANYQNPGIAVWRWNGKHWKKTLKAPAHVTFTGVSTTSSRDGVVVGTYTNGAAEHGVIYRFADGKWHAAKVPGTYSGGTTLDGVSAAGKDLWAIGISATAATTASPATQDTFVIASTNGGKKWKHQVSPDPGTTSFAAISAISKKSAIMAGGYEPTAFSTPVSTFASHNGRAWKAMPAAF